MCYLPKTHLANNPGSQIGLFRKPKTGQSLDIKSMKNESKENMIYP